MIELDRLNDSYYNFPYSPREGDRNSDTYAPCIGGINLQNEPHRINEIPELKYSDALRKLIAELNHPNSPYITLGCAYWQHKDNKEPSYTYVEFSFKSYQTATNLPFIQRIDEQFSEYIFKNKANLALHFEVTEQSLENVQTAIYWSYRHYEIAGEDRILIYFQAGSPHHQDLDIFLELLYRFLTEYLVVPS